MPPIMIAGIVLIVVILIVALCLLGYVKAPPDQAYIISGFRKHRTVIGDNVFVGSDTMMVAPVTIGGGALVGASSCVTKDVPADALYLERSKERIVEGYAARRLERLKKGEA